jgi:6-phosphogluconolactonase
MNNVAVFADQTALMVGAAERVVQLATDAIEKRGRFMWALAGGSTPRELYALLASERFVHQIDWARVHFFWGDERCVPPDHADSNYRMAREALLKVVKPPDEHVHRMRGEDDPVQAAHDYERVLREQFGTAGGSLPRFDLVLLGMGADGHTASLFPGSAPQFETRRLVMAHHVESVASWRLTLTPVTINAAAQIVFLVAGADKAGRLAQVLDQRTEGKVLPAQLIHPGRGELTWMVDTDAAARLDRGQLPAARG